MKIEQPPGHRDYETCPHERLTPEACDQTLGVVCLDCDGLLCWCWSDVHVPETLWNRACENDSAAKPCEQNRADYCAICGDAFTPTAESGAK